MSAGKALVVIDAQTAMFHLSKPLHNSDTVLSNIRALIEKARNASAPVVYLQHSGSPTSVFAKGTAGWQIHSPITPQEMDIIIEKHKADAFFETTLEQRLRELSVETLVVCGFVTEGCVDTTVRRAASLGFKIELVRDAHSTTDSEVLTAGQTIDHHNAVLAIFAEVKKTAEVRFGS
jgi:nicotinamidase-related amidase